MRLAEKVDWKGFKVEIKRRLAKYKKDNEKLDTLLSHNH
jgi:hypothetical protein